MPEPPATCPSPWRERQLNLKLDVMPKPASVSMVELRLHADRIIQRVKAGETLVLTYRGRPALRLEPLPAEELGADDPFYALADLADDTGASLTNEQIDEIVYGS
jgi:antitoxin (DNA-binding transcriptional repressor) of toxin-antitoxin stability system